MRINWNLNSTVQLFQISENLGNNKKPQDTLFIHYHSGFIFNSVADLHLFPIESHLGNAWHPK